VANDGDNDELQIAINTERLMEDATRTGDQLTNLDAAIT